MDGLSAAASGIAVVSLAIQLIDSVRKIQRFLQSIADAPEELSRLIDLLEQLELVLEGVRTVADRQRAQHGDLHVDVSQGVMKAVQTCQKALDRLDRLIERMKHNSTTKDKMARSLTSFRLACKKKDIKDFEVQLHRGVSHLNLALTTNLTALHLHGMQTHVGERMPPHTTSIKLAHELVVLQREVASERRDPSTRKSHGNTRNCDPVSSSYRVPAVQKVIYAGILGIITARILSESDDLVKKGQSRNISIRHEKSWLLIPSFLSRCVQLQYISSFKSIERRLRTYPIVRDNHPVWDMCEFGRVSCIQNLFSSCEISPYSINTEGKTLLHVAAASYHTKLCALLLDLGVETEVVDAYGRRPTGGIVRHTEIRHEITSTYKLFTAVNQEIMFSDFCYGYFGNIYQLPVEDFRSSVLEWVTEENVNLFDPHPLAIVTERLCACSFDLDNKEDMVDIQGWMNIGSHLISLKATIQGIKSGYGKPHSLIEIAVNSTVHPSESQAVGVRLLDMLRASNVDLVGFLKAERRSHLEGSWLPNVPFVKTIDAGKRRLHISDTEPFSLSWDWWIDREGHAFEALNEFRHFEQFTHSFSYDYYRGPLSNWPYIYPTWHFFFMCSQHLHPNKYDKGVASLFQRRFERRWKKKITKQAKINGTWRKPKMPGTWID